MIALAQIVKDTEPIEFISRSLRTTAPHVDGIFLTLNGKTEAETEEAKTMKKLLIKEFPNINFSYIKWEHDFAKARNYNFAQVPGEYDFILWLDADDILRGGENLKAIEQDAKAKNFNSVFFNYLYRVELDEKNNIKDVLIEHLRERLIRNDNSFHWVAPIHETLVPLRDPRMTDTSLCDIVHLSNDDRAASAIQRNIDILETQLAGQGNQQDPRTIYYLAKAYFDLRTPEMWDKAEAYIHKYLNGSETNTPSGWKEERAQAWEYLSEIYRDRGQLNKAEKALHNALIEWALFPNFYIDMALLMVYKKDWAMAKHWAKLSQSVEYPKTTLVTNPRDMKARFFETLFHIAINTNNVEAAHEAATKLKDVFPNDQNLITRCQALAEVKRNNELAHKFIAVAQYLQETGQPDKLAYLVNAIPRQIEEEPIFVGLRQDCMPARKWNKNEIAIMCGKGFEPWSPRNLAKGIGGSEEAVIYLANELQKLGWNVTVFGDPQEARGEYNGVNYRPYFEFNPNDIFNILIGWRSIQFFDTEWKSHKNFLWLHDIQNPNEYLPQRVDKLNRIFALSKWHRDNMPNVSDDKFLLTANGINVMDFKRFENIKRNPHQVFYGSSYDRGLEHLLKMWPDVRKAVPDATLRICYGWNLFESFYHNNPERMAWKKKMDDLMTQEGITHLGRIGQMDVIKEQFEAGIWAYPTHFGEISCITAMKSQAAGAIPVVTNYAALDETVQFGVKVPVKDGEDIYDPEKRNEFKDALIKALEDVKWQEQIRPAMMQWAQDKYNWEEVAKVWDKEFRRDDLQEAADVLLAHDASLGKYLPVELQEKNGIKQTI